MKGIELRESSKEFEMNDKTFKAADTILAKMQYFTLGLLAMAILVLHLYFNAIPKCHEDVTLVGVGNFGRGRWSSYECGPALDDFSGAPIVKGGKLSPDFNSRWADKATSP